MADLASLRKIIDTISGVQNFPAGVFGGNDKVQQHAEDLKLAFAKWFIDSSSDQKKEEFHAALLLAHTMSVLSDKELDTCEELMGGD